VHVAKSVPYRDSLLPIQNRKVLAIYRRFTSRSPKWKGTQPLRLCLSVCTTPNERLIRHELGNRDTAFCRASLMRSRIPTLRSQILDGCSMVTSITKCGYASLSALLQICPQYMFFPGCALYISRQLCSQDIRLGLGAIVVAETGVHDTAR
jgi:hypothetical protein